MSISSLSAAQPTAIHHHHAHGAKPKAQPDAAQTGTTQASDLQQQQALEAEQSVNLLV